MSATGRKFRDQSPAGDEVDQMGSTCVTARATRYGRRRWRAGTGTGLPQFGKRRQDGRLEVQQDFGPNVVRLTMTAGSKKWYVFGAYVYPNNQMLVHWVNQARERGPAGVEMILVGDLNARREQLRDQRVDYLATAIANYGIVDQSLHVILRQRYRGKGGR